MRQRERYRERERERREVERETREREMGRQPIITDTNERIHTKMHIRSTHTQHK